MNTAEMIEEAVSANDTAMDDILRLQLRIARRADELAHGRMHAKDEFTDWQLWREAEEEILGDKGWGNP